MKKGAFYWITGLSDSGKTTIANALVDLLREKNKNVILVDGDQVRDVFALRQTYTLEDRKAWGFQYGRLSRMLVNQGVIVVCATISMFKECHEWNRANVEDYREIYISVPMDILKQRDSKNIYKRAFNGELKNVVGVDLPFDEPENPDMIINNNGEKSPQKIALEIYEHYNGK